DLLDVGGRVEDDRRNLLEARPRVELVAEEAGSADSATQLDGAYGVVAEARLALPLARLAEEHPRPQLGDAGAQGQIVVGEPHRSAVWSDVAVRGEKAQQLGHLLRDHRPGGRLGEELMQREAIARLDGPGGNDRAVG